MRFLLAISLSLNLWIAIWIFQRRAAEHPIHRETSTPSATSESSTPPGGRNRGAAKFDGPNPIRWADLESTDYATFIANLRAAGCPETLVRDIVAMDIRRTFADRARAIMGQPASIDYWKKYSNSNPNLEQQAALKKLTEEESAAVQSLLGAKMSRQELIDNVLLQLDFHQAELAWLPDDKKEAAIHAFSEAGLRDMDLENNDSPANRLDLLKDILTPEELAEYKLRTDPEASRVSTSLRYANLTQDEFKTLMTSGDHPAPSGRNVNALHPADSLLTPEVIAAIGPDRAAEIQRKSGESYVQFRAAADYYNLPPETADEAMQIIQNANTQEHQIERDKSLPASERNDRINAISEAARKQLASYFGQDGERVTKTFTRALLKAHP